jgi:two-component system OmpR family response regulator
MKHWPHILIVDDDEEILSLLGRYLATQEFRVTLASDGRDLENLLATSEIDLIVLDVMLPSRSGLSICQELRVQKSPIPIILLTALKEDVDRIIGLEIGADDYIGKPFNPRELVARIRAVLRRHNFDARAADRRSYRFGGFLLEPDKRQVVDPAGHQVDFTGAEFELLHALVARPGRILSRDQLLDLTHGRDGDPFDRSIDVLMSRIRRKLGPDGFRSIKTVRNGGYQFTAEVETTGAAP